MPFRSWGCSARRRTCGALLLAGLAMLLAAGCARFPEGADQTQVRRRLTVTFDVAGRINPNYYYFIAIDTTGDPGAGPVPVVSAPFGNGWGTGEITHYVRYHLGSFEVFRFREGSNLLLPDPLGTPFQFNRPEDAPGNRIQVVLDLDTLRATTDAPLDRINLNIITTDRIDIEPTFLATKMYDALGATGNHFVNFSVNVNQTLSNATALFGDPEEAGDLPPQPAPGVEVNDLDLVNWSVEVRANQ